MQARHVELTASGQVQPNPSNQGPRGTDPVNVYVVGLSAKGTSVTVDLYDGTSATGTPVVSISGPGVYSFSYEIRFQNGCYAALGGTTPSVSIWLA